MLKTFMKGLQRILHVENIHERTSRTLVVNSKNIKVSSFESNEDTQKEESGLYCTN